MEAKDSRRDVVVKSDYRRLLVEAVARDAVSRETISAACFRGTPAATSSATASRAGASSAPASLRPEHERDLALRRLGEPLRELGRCASRDLLEPLRQLAAHGRLALGRHRGKRTQRRGQPLRRLERHRRPRPRRQLAPQLPQPLLAARQEPEEAVLLGDEPRRHQRRLDRRRPRQHRHLDACLERRPHEARARIGDARHPRIRHESHALAAGEPRQDLGRALRLVVLVIGDEPRLDPVTLEQAARVPRVLAEDDIGRRELGEDAKRHVLEVPDRRRADASGIRDRTPPARPSDRRPPVRRGRRTRHVRPGEAPS